MTRDKLRPRYVVYDENGDRVARISVGHDGEFAHSDVDTELLTAVPSHQINTKNISDKEVADVQTQPLSQSLARTRYNNISGKTDSWEYKCPLLRQPVTDVSIDSGKDVQRIQWIDSERGDGRDADPHIYVSSIARFKAQRYVPKWALEDLAHKVGLDGFAQIMSYELLQLEREIIDAHPTENLSDEELYIHVVDKYRLKFTAKELAKLENLVPKKLDENEDNITEDMFGETISLFDKYKKQWAQALSGKKTVSDVDWYSYSYTVEGPDFNSVDAAEEWITELEDKFNQQWEQLLQKVKDGEVSVTTDKITPRPVSAIDDPNKDVSVKTKSKSEYDSVVYREWWEIDEIPALAMYCPNCGEKVYADHGEHHTFDYSFKVDCHNCDMRLTPYNMITTPRNKYNLDTINIDSSQITNTLKAYWNRAMRYGFRLGDRIAVDLRATEFNQYADELDIDWDMKCPFYRKPVNELDNEGLDDVEFNHIEYEDDDGNSRAQMAEGFTVSRSAHDILHMNHPQWMWEYYMGDPVEQRKYQIYKLINEEKIVYESIYNTEVEQLDSEYLDHIRRYYDIGHYAKDELINIYIEVAEQEDEIVEAYESTKDKCANKFAGNNDKGLDTKDQVKQFIQAKEERNEQYLSKLQERAKNGNIDAFEGDEMGLIHPLVKQYE